MLRVNVVAYDLIRRTIRTAAKKNHVILRHLYRFLPEESDKLAATQVLFKLHLA